MKYHAYEKTIARKSSHDSCHSNCIRHLDRNICSFSIESFTDMKKSCIGKTIMNRSDKELQYSRVVHQRNQHDAC